MVAPYTVEEEVEEELEGILSANWSKEN